ncbi:MAG TPA: PDZ domain-containing protein [Chitinophagales bacterium]|nr:PDZ domain-containing protein [Chitinophagales bacterium]
MQRFLFSITTLIIPAMLFAQQPDNQIHLRIDANVDGQQVKIDTFIESLGDLNLDEFLQGLGLENELNQLNIDINSGFGVMPSFDEEAMQEMLKSLSELEMPEMPELPELPGIDMGEAMSFGYAGENRAFLGVYTNKVTEGAQISDIVEGSAAESAGLMEGDIITHIDARSIESPANLMEVLALYYPGDEVTVTYIRAGKTDKVKLTLQENTNASSTWGSQNYNFNFDFPDSIFMGQGNYLIETPAHGYLGVYLEDADGKVLVTGIEGGSAAEKAGLKADDILLEIKGNKVQSYDEVLEIMQETKPDEKIHIIYERGGKRKETDATLKSAGGGAYYFNFNNDEGYNNDIRIAPCLPTPPGSSYSYYSRDSSKTINICITGAYAGDYGDSTGGFLPDQAHPLMDPNNLAVYANPSDGTFRIHVDLPEEGDAKVVITDMAGKEVYNELLPNFSGTFDRTVTLSNASKGTYFVKVTQKGYSSTRTVVIQ